MALKHISIRVEPTTYNLIIKRARKEGITWTELIRGMLKSSAENQKEIIIVNSVGEELSDWKKLEEEFIVKSKLVTKCNNATMKIIVQKEEYDNIVVPPEKTERQIIILINAIDGELDRVDIEPEDSLHLFALKRRLKEKNYEVLKDLIDYKTLRWKWILGGKIAANKYETKALEERVLKFKQKAMKG